MSLYKDASLVMIPSAYKDGKLYSIRPTDGSGDFTFSRGSNLAATRVDVNGLIEKGRENLLLQSNQFDTTWVKSSSVLTLTDNQSGYDGLSNAWKLESTSSISSLSLSQTEASSGLQVFSVYAKAGSVDWVRINLSGLGNRFFNISNGTIGSAGSLEGTITSAGNGWYRCSVLGNGSSTAPYVFLASDNNNLSVNAGDNIYIQDAQLEQGLVATDYIETGTSAAQSGILEDMPRLDYSGGASCPSLLLEPQRSNLITHSELLTDSSWTNQLGGTIDVGQASAVSGYNDAWKLNKASGTFKSLRLQKTLASGNYTLTWFLKEGTISIAEFRFDGGLGAQFIDFDLSSGTHGTNANLSNIEMVAFNDGWYRCSASINTNLTNVHLYIDDASVSSGAGYIYAQYPQLESGSYPTSYIPTYGTSQTRSNEAATSPADTLDSLSAFTWFFEISRIGFSGDMSSSALSLRTASGAEQIRCHFDAPSQQIRIRDAINGYTTIGASLPVTVGTYIKICVVSDGETIKTFANGSQRGGAYNIVTQHDVERVYMNGKGFNCKQLLVFPTALTDSECIALTTL